jgi:hypothetical protein
MKRTSFTKIVLRNSIKIITENWKVDPYISQTLEPNATNFGQFVRRAHPCLPAKFQSTPPINDEVIQGGAKTSRQK